MVKTILVVDDSSSIRQAVAMTLRDEGYEVIEAENGQDALAKLKGKSVQLMFVDLNMPCMDGIEFIRAVRGSESCRYVPILVLTTESQLSRKLEGQQAGATGWIVKPFSGRQIADMARRLVGT